MQPESLLLLGFIFSIPIFGFILLKLKPQLLLIVGWIFVLSTVIYVPNLTNETALLKMGLLIIGVFWSFKLVVAYYQLDKKHPINLIQWCLFCYAWFGMNPKAFLSFPGKAISGYGKLILQGLIRILIGFTIINLGHFLFFKSTNYYEIKLLELLYLIGLSLILHFGLLQISTGLLRLQGINVGLLFNKPFNSKSLKEFWGKRWNLAFVELTTIAVFRPMKKTWGTTTAFWIGFVFSGLLHEMAISLPVNAGYGRPFLFFIVQAALINFVEKYIIKPNTNKFLIKIWLGVCLLLPIFILFHQKFITEIIYPLAGFLLI